MQLGVGRAGQIAVDLAWRLRLEWYAARLEARRKREDARLSARRAEALVEVLRCDTPTGAQREPDDNSAELLALTSAPGSREGYPGATPLSAPGFSRAQEVEGSTLQNLHSALEEGHGARGDLLTRQSELGEKAARGSKTGRGRPKKARAGCETPVAGCEDGYAVADGASERVLGSGVVVTEVRTGPRGERIEVLSEGTLDVIRQARLDKTNKWRLARGLEPKKPWWGPGKDGPDPAKAPPEPKPTSRKVVRRRKLADGTTEETEITPRRKK